MDVLNAVSAPPPSRPRPRARYRSWSPCSTKRPCCRSFIAASASFLTASQYPLKSSMSTTAVGTARWRSSPTLHDTDPRVAVVDLSRNFGKEVAMSAGLDHANGDAVIVIDADLQDPPELIPEMVRAWHEGYDVVLMRRRSRDQESWLKKTTARAFYRAIGRMGTIDIPENVGDFRLLSHRAVTALRRFPERSRFMKGLFAWVGFPCREIEYDRDGRHAGETKWSYWRLWNFALEGITSFSVVPLKAASYIGIATALVAFAYGGYVVRQDVAPRRPGPRLPDARHAGAVSRRPAADGARHHRRIPRPHVHRGQAASALSGPAAPVAVYGPFPRRRRSATRCCRRHGPRPDRARAPHRCARHHRPRRSAARHARRVPADGFDRVALRRDRTKNAGDRQLAHAAIRLRHSVLGKAAAVDLVVGGKHGHDPHR